MRSIPIHDIRGNIVALLDFQGKTLEEYFYTAYGEREIISPKDGVQLYSALGNPWQYAGKRFDEETGLVAFGMRYYDPALARWTTPDPAGFLDGINLYAYVHNNPMLYIDRYGLFGESFFAGLQDFEWKSSFKDSSFYQSFESTAQNIWNSPRFQGSIQAIGGFAEAGFGAGMTYVTGGLAAPAGCAVMAHGLDHFFTGMNSVITGRPAESVTSQLFQTAGMSPQNAHLLDTGLSVAGSLTGMKLAQQGASAFKASTLNTDGKFIAAELKYATNAGMPSLDSLSRAGQVMDRGGLTKAGRALDKHGGRVNSIFPKAVGNPANKNMQGQFHLDDILTHPGSRVSRWEHRGFGKVIDIEIPGRGGVRFDQNGNFIGLLEP